MKNLKINNEWFKKTISTALVLVTLSNLSGCSVKNNEETLETEGVTVTTVIANNRMIKLSDLRLKNLDTKEIVDIASVEALLIDNKLDREIDLVKIIFDSNVESILVNDEFISVEKLGLFNVVTNQDISKLDYVLDGDDVDHIKDYVSEEEIKEETDKTETVEEEYVELTDEKFYELVDLVYEKYSEIGLDVSKEEVTDYVMFVNVDRIAKDNKELIETIVGDRKIENLELNAFDVYSAVATRNNENYCAKGLGFDSLILVSDTVFDNKDKNEMIKLEGRIKELIEVSSDKEEFNKLLNKLLMEMLNATEEEFNMEYGTGYSAMTILINFVRINFTNILDEANSELIKYFISYAEEYGTSYYENSRSTAYYSGIYNLITDTLSCAKTRTK